MISNKDPQLTDQLKRLWQESAERLKKREAAASNLEYVELTKSPTELEALKLIDEKKARQLMAAAFKRQGSAVAIAVLNPKKQGLADLIKELQSRGLTVKMFLASLESLKYAWSFYEFVPKQASAITSRVDIEAGRVLELQKELTSLAKIKSRLDSQLIKAGNLGTILEIILAGALTTGASDIHFEPAENEAGVRYRIDGTLRDFGIRMGKNIYSQIISRLKLLANLKLNITKAAQDGRFSIGLGETQIEIRVSVIPSEFGETIVLRVLDPRIIALSISELGMRADDLKIAAAQLKAPNGMILNTGPTGSGKTTTLYAFLKKVSSSENKVITIEDPIEYHLKGIEQTQVEEKSGYGFGSGLQSIMRQDPDVILVGEIRDKETVSIAIQAALTGHLVFSTLHTNSAAGVIPRLLDLGAPTTSIGPALNLIISQRLVRKLCEKCKKAVELSAELKTKIENFIRRLPERVDKSSLKEVQLFDVKENGCEACHHSGYKGRLGIFELLGVSEEMEPLINEKSSEGVIMKYAREHGLVTLQQDAILKALSGITSLKEVEEVTGEITW